jgi:trigger factor
VIASARPIGPSLPKLPPVDTTVENLNPARVKINAEVAADDVAGRVDRAARDLGSELKLPGFRKGKVPPQLVIQRVGREAVFEHALRESLPEWYERAILDSGVSPIGEPQLDLSDVPAEGEGLSFSIEISVRPPARLGDYKGLEVARAEPEVPEGAVDEEIDRMREGFASLAPVERAASEGDHLLIDFTGSVDGEEFEGGQASDYLLELGSDSLIPGFEEGLIGAEAGEERAVQVTFPDEYGAEHLAGKDALFQVTVKEVREKRLPDADDDFAADNSDFDTIAELREDVESRVLHAQEHRVEDEFREAVLDAVVANAEIELDDELIDARAEEVWERIERQIRQSGMEPEMYLQMQGKSREEAIAEARPDAEQGLRRESALEAIADAEEIEVTEEEMLEALQPPAGEKGKPEKLLKRLRKEGRDVLLVEEIRLRKAADVVIESAEPIPAARAEAREQIWTPEDEAGGKQGEIWTPEGSTDEPPAEGDTGEKD